MVRAFRKNSVMSFFVCVVTVVAIVAGNDEEFFLRGNKQYAQKDYDNAFHSYDMMSKKGRAVFYNMGNCCFHKGDYAQALVYWSRAEVGANSKERAIIGRNKERVFAVVGKEQNQSLWSRINKCVNDLAPYMSLIILQLLFLLCWYLFIFFARKKQMKSKRLILTCLSFFMIIAGLVLEIHYTGQSMHNGIVVKKEAQLFVGPDKGLQALCPVVYANNVIVKEIREGWYKIQYADMIGWVEADVVQVV